MQSYTFIPGVHIRPQEVSYGEVPFQNFTVREVFIDKQPKGEYHIKLQNNLPINIKIAERFFFNSLHGCEIGIIDPTNTLNLEYHIYIKTTDKLKITSMISIMESLDNDLSEILK